MGCCGRKRSSSAGVASTVLHTPALGPPSLRDVVLRYREHTRVVVRGPVTGRAYEFSAQQPTRAVESRDAAWLLRTQRFVRA